jgi:endonuclease YncB( thermonuclease family)
MGSALAIDRRRSILFRGCALGVWGCIAVGTAVGQTADPSAEGSAGSSTTASQAGGRGVSADLSSPIAVAPALATALPTAGAPTAPTAQAPAIPSVAAPAVSAPLPMAAVPAAPMAAAPAVSTTVPTAAVPAAAMAAVPAVSAPVPTAPMAAAPAISTLAAPAAPMAAAPALSTAMPMAVAPAVPMAAAPAMRATLPDATPRDNVQDNIPSGAEWSGQPRTPSPGAVPSDGGQMPSVVTVQPAVIEPLSLDHPTVVDTATFESGGTTVALYGVEGVKGEMADGLQGFLTAHGNRMTCQVQASADFVCLQPDGTDVAEVALVNGAARAKPDAPAPYRDQEAAAQAARRGIWANLPPPPATVKHPTVPNTATLVADGQTYVLDGVLGLGSPFAEQMQTYIAQHGDSLVCDPQMLPGHYTCLLADGTDVAKTALVNGAARVGPDAPDAYRVQQAEALNNHRGFWLNQSEEMIMANATVVQAPPACCAFVGGDDGVDGITYVAGVPTAVIEGETVFIAYGGDLGWGYYDHWHHWRGVPGHYREHLEHFHPYGHGLRGYGHEEAVHHGEAVRREAAFHPGGMHPGIEPQGMRTGVVSSGMHPGMVAPGMRPGSVGAPGMQHPSGLGGGFIRPGPSAAGFHPGGAAVMAHAAPAMHVSSGGGGGGKKR